VFINISAISWRCRIILGHPFYVSVQIHNINILGPGFYHSIFTCITVSLSNLRITMSLSNLRITMSLSNLRITVSLSNLRITVSLSNLRITVSLSNLLTYYYESV
jgi:putative Mn2+ efflux pump MntP